MAVGMSSRFIFWLVLALCAAVGSDCLLDSAESLPISTYCVSADQCAALCRRFVEGDRGPEDFIRQAAYELGPPDTFKLPQSSASTLPSEFIFAREMFLQPVSRATSAVGGR